MNVLITGCSGFIGRELCKSLLAEGHSIWGLSRNPSKLLPPISGISRLSDLDNQQIDIVINLAGEPIADKRWSKKQKQKILSSRIDTTKNIVEYFEKSAHKPSLLINGSAIGFYGTARTDEPITEQSGSDTSFASLLCQQWESEALKAKELGIKVCLLRIGIVLGQGGALAKMYQPFKLGLGGVIGDGQHWMSWIHMADLVGLIKHCIKNEIVGPINATAPNPVTNQIFTETLASALNRPAFFPMPALTIKLFFGQMGEELLLSGKKVMPNKALENDFAFKYLHLADALKKVLPD